MNRKTKVFTSLTLVSLVAATLITCKGGGLEQVHNLSGTWMIPGSIAPDRSYGYLKRDITECCG